MYYDPTGIETRGILLKTVLMDIEKSEIVAPAVTANSPATKAYSTKSCALSSRKMVLSRM